MTTIPRHSIGRFVLEPIRGWPLVASAAAVWLGGAAYCHGYERLLSGLGSWPGSFLWSAIAILPWFALFEWSKQSQGNRFTANGAALLGLAIVIAALSILLEYAVHWSFDQSTRPVGLLMLRRLPAIIATLTLILITRRDDERQGRLSASGNLESLASSIEYVAAADNYVEVHLPARVVLTRMTLSQATILLRNHGFVRVHRRFLVNRARIRAVDRRGRRHVRMSSGAEIPIGRAYWTDFAVVDVTGSRPA